MPAPRPEIADLLEVDVPPGGKVITASDLHLPPERTDVSGRCCETLAQRLDGETGPLIVVLEAAGGAAAAPAPAQAPAPAAAAPSPAGTRAHRSRRRTAAITPTPRCRKLRLS